MKIKKEKIKEEIIARNFDTGHGPEEMSKEELARWLCLVERS